VSGTCILGSFSIRLIKIAVIYKFLQLANGFNQTHRFLEIVNSMSALQSHLEHKTMSFLIASESALFSLHFFRVLITKNFVQSVIAPPPIFFSH